MGSMGGPLERGAGYRDVEPDDGMLRVGVRGRVEYLCTKYSVVPVRLEHADA